MTHGEISQMDDCWNSAMYKILTRHFLYLRSFAVFSNSLSETLHKPNPSETRPAKPEIIGASLQTTAWTYRYKESGQPATHKLFDQIWLSPALEKAFKGATIDRRTKHGGDGSDHDPAWIELKI